MSELEPTVTSLPALPVEQRPEIDPYEVYLATLPSPESKRTMRGALDRIARDQTGDPEATGAWQPWWELRYEHTTRIRDALASYRDENHPNGYSPTHVNKHLIALRRVLRTCWRMGLMSAEEFQSAADIPNVPGSRRKAGRRVHQDELATLLAVCAEGDGPAAVRDAAIVAVLYVTGIRRAEAASLLVERYDVGEREIQLIGKRNKEREVFVAPSAVPVLDRWLALLNTRRGPMFRPIDKHGNILDRFMTPSAIAYVVDRTRRKAGLPPLATHDMRRTYGSDLFAKGVALPTVQRLMGHSSATTTANYDRRPKEELRDASDLLTLPSAEAAQDDDSSSAPQRSAVEIARKIRADLEGGCARADLGDVQDLVAAILDNDDPLPHDRTEAT